MKKTINLKVLMKNNTGKELDIYELFPNINKQNFEFIPSENPDFIIYEPTVNSKYLDYKCVRIAVCIERCTPDFNICDYAISDDIMQFEGRHFRMPYLAYPFMRQDVELTKEKCSIKPKMEDLDKKDLFCNFIYSDAYSDNMRGVLFNLLSSYKFVHSGGRLLNNMGGQIAGGIGNYDEKIKFQSRCKFTLAIENVMAPGYTTEKILHAFRARTVPIYWGNPSISEFFNKEAFIDCNDYDSLEDLMKRIKKVDQDNDLYLNILNKPVFNENFDLSKLDENTGRFMENIFSQDPEKAYRRSRVLHSLSHELDFKKGRKATERKRALEHKIIRLLKKVGIRNSKLYQWYNNKYFLK